ncbi:MAG TPA: DNA mismatch repair protein MutS [Bacteroidia bacterium]|nr:DNA mismatch repair protein MutS [Bacteroidia bacterium]HNS13505.1 DNA mismatch repair protein MutS [Bacteroidia bacterium]
MKIHGDDIFKLFEFDKVCEHLAAYCRSAASRRLAFALKPIENRDDLMIRLKQTDEYRNSLANKGHFPDTSFEDFEDDCQLLSKQGSMLSEMQFSRIRSASTTVNALLKFLSERKTFYPALSELTSNVYETKEIISEIDSIIDLHGIVKNNASKELQEIRNLLQAKRKEADKRFRSFINELNKKGWLRENEENFYNNRRVLAIPSEYKRNVKGLIHGKSESGKTTFIEPEELVELNNAVSELEQDERTEIIRLLRELTEKLRIHSPLILAYHNLLTQIDLVRAKALYALELNAHLPKIEKHSKVELYDALHPLLYVKNKKLNKSVVPLSISLDQTNRILIISGPNAGGKSITLKTVGLLQLMLQSGLLVPAKEKSVMCFFNHFLADIGDSQSIENALSTYSSRLIRMNDFLRSANNRSLILIDEFGTGTDPELGGAIAEAVLEELNKRKAFGVFTTHYTNIKLIAENLPGVQNASMLFDPETLSPKYMLITGQPGSSYTFEVAERIGLPQHVLEKAKQKVQKDKLKLNTLLAGLHLQKNKQEEQSKSLKYQEAKSSAAERHYKDLLKNLEAKIERDKTKREELVKLAQLGRKMNNYLDEWEKTRDRKAIIKKFVGNLTAEVKRKKAENTPEKVEKRTKALIEKLKAEISVGTHVRMLKSKQTGIVEEIRKNDVVVQFGAIRAIVAIQNLQIVKQSDSSDE